MWLNLPKDIPKSYMHLSFKVGGISMSSLGISIPYLIYYRLKSLTESSSNNVKNIYESDWVQGRINGRMEDCIQMVSLELQKEQ